MENNEIRDMLLDLKKGQDETNKIVNDLKKGQDELFRGQEKLFKGQEELFKGQEELSKGQEELFKGKDELFIGQKQLFEELDKLSLSVARIEVEHGEKLDILLDVVTGHTEKFNSANERVEKCEKRLDNQDDKIYVLNSVVHAY